MPAVDAEADFYATFRAGGARKNRVGDIVPAEDGDGEVLIVTVSESGVNAIDLRMVALVLGAWKVREARRL